MTKQDFQDRLDAIVRDLQTKGKGQSVNIILRNQDNVPEVLVLSSNPAGVVNPAQLAALQAQVDYHGAVADAFETQSAPVQAALEAFKTASEPHEALMTAATNARKALSDALEADAGYQAAKTALDNARALPAYINAREQYQFRNISENYSEFQNAKGKYVG